MKGKLSRMGRSGISFLLAFCMLASMFTGVAFASEPETKKYVSLGDSMTNGYGLEGYDHNSGVADYGTRAYPNQFAENLKKLGYKVDHAQLAMSGIRTEDIHWLLEFDYNDPDAVATVQSMLGGGYGKENWDGVAWNKKFSCGDFWTLSEICNHSRTDATYYAIAGGTYEGITHESMLPADYEYPETYNKSADMSYGKNRAMKIALIAKYYQEHVADADVITLSVGNGNLGVFGFGRILEAIGFYEATTLGNYNYEDILRECDDNMKERLMGLINEIKPMMAGYLPDPNLEGVVLYIATSLAMNYAGTVDAILQMNPNVEIVLIPVMNTFGDNYATVEGKLTIGDLLQLVVDPLNKFIAGLPTYMQVTNHGVYKYAKFYWAEPGESIECMVDTYTDPLEAGSTVRKRFVESIVGAESDPGMIWEMLGNKVVPVSLEEIENYEKMDGADKVAYAAANADKATSISMYLAFEKAIVLGKDNPVTLDSVFGLTDLFKPGANPFGPIMEAFEAAVPGAITAEVLANVAAGLAPVVKATLETEAAKLLEEMAGITDATIDMEAITADEILSVMIIGNADSIAAKGAAAIVDAVRDTYVAGAAEGVVLAVDTLLATMNDTVNAQLSPMDKSISLNSKDYMNMGIKPPLDEVDGEMLASVFYKDAIAQPFGGDCLADYVDGALKEALGEEGYAYAGITGADVVAAAKATIDTNDTNDSMKKLFDEAIAAAGSLETEETIAAATEAYINTKLGEGVTLRGFISGMVVDAVNEYATSLATLLVMPETLGAVVGAEKLYTEENPEGVDNNLGGLLALFARCVIGNGIGAHPAEGGHDTRAKAVIDAYGKHTAEDETDENLKDLEQWPVAKKIISDLTALEYLNDDQILEIVFYLYENADVIGEDFMAVADKIYTVVLKNANLNNTQRLEIISIVYNDLRNGEKDYLKEYDKYLNALEDIVANENIKKHVTDDEAFTIVEMAYGYAVTGAPSVREIIAYIWKDVLATAQPTPKVRLFMMRSAPDPVMSAADKIGLLEDIFEALKNNEVLDAPEVEKIETLYNNLTAVDADGDQVIPDEVLNDLFDEIVDVIGDPAKDLSDPAVLTDVTTNIADTLLNDERIKPENKVAILEEVSNTLGEFGVEVTIPGLGGSESEYDLSVLIALRDALEAAGYLTKKQQGEIISAVAGVLPAVMAGEELNQEEMVAVAEKVYNIVFNREDLTLWDKITILAITYSVLDEYGYVNFAYAEAYAAADKAGYVDEAVKYIEIAIEAIEEAKNAVADFKVSAKLDGVKDALQKELDATNRTLGEIKALLETDALATKPGAWAEMVALRDDLDNQIAKIKTLADEIGFVAAPYVQKAIDAYNYYTKLLADVAADAYAWVANGVDEFAKEYAELVEEIGKIADELHPDLGKAVRKYLTETPADTLEILFAHGESAVNVLLAKAADASEDIGNIAYALGKVIYEKGDIIGKEIAKSEEVANIKAEIDVAYKDLLKLYDEVSKAPVSTDYNAKINGAQKNLGILYGKLFGEIGNIIGYVAGEDYSELLDKAWISLQDLADTTGYAGEYGQWIAGDMQIMAGQLLAAFFENNSEFMQVFVPLFCENMKATNEYLSNLAKEYGDKAWAMYENIRDEVIPGIIATIKEYGDQAWIMIRNQMNTICGIVDDVYENVMNILGELNKKLDELKEAVQDEAKAIADAIEAMLEELKELLAKASGLSQDVLDKINDAIANVQDALDAFRDVINGDFESIGEMLEALDEAKDNLLAALQNLHDILKAEAKDIYDQVSGKINAICDMINCLIDNREEIANWLLEELVKALPAIDAKLYDFFYNNPDKVISFFEENGEFFAEHYEIGLAVLGYVAVAFGPDVVEWVIENPEEAFEAFVGWYEKYGNRTWAMIDVYLAELGVYDNISEGVGAILGKLNMDLSELREKLEELKDTVQDEAQAIVDEIEDLLEDIQELLSKANGLTKDALDKINDAIADVKEALDNLRDVINGEYESFKDMLIDLIEAKDNLIAALQNLSDVLQSEAKEIYDQVTGAIDSAKAALDAFKTAIYNALHGEYTVSKDSLYVPIGDADYAEELAALLGLKADQIGNELTEDADLITVDFGGSDTADFINAQLVGMVAGVIKNDATLSGLLKGKFGPTIEEVLAGYGVDLTADVAELPWESLLDEETIRAKDKLVAKIVADAVEDGRIVEKYTLDVGAMVQPIIDAELGVPGLVTIDCVVEIPVAELAAELLDNVLFCYVAVAAERAATLDEIRETAPNAEIVVLGMEADDEDLVFGVGDFTMDFSEYGEILAGFVNAHYFAYALMYGENVTFVAENSAKAIYAALNVSYEKTGLWGDANGDGIVNTTDARLVLQYYTSAGSVAINTAVCDVDGKNGINTTDARLILQHYTSGGTMRFPVEE